MTDWPTGWREATLRQADIPVTQTALDMLSAWRKSTPLEPWTNNPLGMPAKGYKAATVLRTSYALFPSMLAFRNAFCLFLASRDGYHIHDALTSPGTMAILWQNVRALAWPAGTTETNYPAAVLALADPSDRPLPGEDVSGNTKSSGTIGASSSTQSTSGASQRVGNDAISVLIAAAGAHQSITEGMG